MGEVRIVDRRHDSRNKSAVNRGRFIRRFRQQIRKAVADALVDRSVADIDQGERISIPARDISEPQFTYGRGGLRREVLPGNDRFHSGDEIARPAPRDSPMGQQPGNEGEGQDDFLFALSREEFLDIFFDDLALPNMVRAELARIADFRHVRAGYTQTGVPTNINVKRSLRGAAGRRMAAAAPYRKELAAARSRLEALESGAAGDGEEAQGLRRRIAVLLRQLERIPFIDSFDLRYNNRVRIPQASSRAVMFCLMDVSGSMDQHKKQIAKRFFMLLYLFLQRSYEHIDIVFIRHHTQAYEVGEDDFFHSRETGGTVVSSALELMRQIMLDRYSTSAWNIYAAQASDGENWDNDSPQCAALLDDSIVPRLRYYAYIEISTEGAQNLWFEYRKVAERHPGVFAMRRITDLPDIYPVFHELFRKKQPQ